MGACNGELKEGSFDDQHGEKDGRSFFSPLCKRDTTSEKTLKKAYFFMYIKADVYEYIESMSFYEFRSSFLFFSHRLRAKCFDVVAGSTPVARHFGTDTLFEWSCWSERNGRGGGWSRG